MARNRRRKKVLRVPASTVLSPEQIDEYVRRAAQTLRETEEQIRHCFVIPRMSEIFRCADRSARAVHRA